MTTPQHPRPGYGDWSAVIYGRTFRVDQWWRALPTGIDRQGPVGRAVRAAVAGGDRLEQGPRFLLQRDEHGVLVGAACEFTPLSTTMGHDRFGRPLYGFVGWYSRTPATARFPGLTELAAGFERWAAPVYQEWVTRTWQAVDRLEAEPCATAPRPAPWGPEPAAPGPAELTAAGGWRPARAGYAHLLPRSQAGPLWASARTAARERCVLVTGWQRRSDADLRRITHLCSADATGYELVVVPPPRPAAPPRGAGAASGPASGPQSGSRQAAYDRPDPDHPRDEGDTPWYRGAVDAVSGAFDRLIGCGPPDEADHRPPPSPPTSPVPPPRSGGHRREPVREGRPDKPGWAPWSSNRGRRPSEGAGGAPVPPQGPSGGTAPAARRPQPPSAERPLFDRTASADPQQADYSGMFGGFDEPAPATEPATEPAPRTTAPPADGSPTDGPPAVTPSGDGAGPRTETETDPDTTPPGGAS
ncbi:hypothetical protein GCM10009665_27680 [Kitasatospora nipponensis]|uniref:Uncharacterized protein n=1 Tax=Kitasatospora nipponensis TaxID=258049 RepID=A0ABP4GS24_9ACTN